MLRRKQSKAYRFVAAFLALLMLASLIPVSHAGLVQAADILESYTVTLTDGSQDGEGNYIPLTQEGAEVTLTDPALQEMEPLSASTDANGVATFANCVEDGKTYQLSVTGVNGYEDLVSTNVTPALNDINYYAVLTPAQPQPVTTTISGTVNGSDGQGYSGAQVSLFEGTIEESEAALFTTDTDASGGYTFPNVDISKSYTIRVEPKGEDPQYKTGEISITGLTAEPYTASTLTLEKEQFSIAVDAKENGSVTVNGSGAPFLVDYGENAEIKVEAATGYRIGTLTVDNEIVVAEAAGQQNYTYTISAVTKGHKVSVTFLRQTYTITFTVGENGQVSYPDGETIQGGSVEVKSNEFQESTDPENPTKVAVTATPDVNYRVKEVKIDGTSVNDDENQRNDLEVANNGGYKTDLEMTKDYTFSVTFELNKYEISVADEAKDYISVSQNEAEHGSDVTATITPPEGKTIFAFTVNGEQVDLSRLSLVEGNRYEIQYSQTVTGDVVFNADFGDISELQGNYQDYVSISQPLQQIGDQYIYSNNTQSVILKAAEGYEGIAVNGSYSVGTSGWSTDTSKEVETIQVLDGVVLKQVTMESPIQIIIDKGKPEVTDVQTTADSWTNQAVTVTVTAADEGNFASGVARVVYNTEQTVEGAQEAQRNQDGKYSFTLDSEQNATYYIYAVDRSGNVSAAAQTEVQIDQTSPEITGFSFSSQEDAAVSDGINFKKFGIYSANPIYVTVTADDDASGVASITLYKGEEEIDPLEVSNGSATFKLDANAFADGAEITAVATDVAGSASDQKGPADTGSALSNFVQINATAPTVTIVPDDPGYTAENSAKWYGGDTKFTVTISDENVGIQDVQILLNKQDITSLIVKEDFTAQEVSSVDYIIDTSVIEQVAQRPEDGSYTLEVTATNNAGVPYDENPETEDKEPATDTVYLDVAAPNMEGVTIETYQGSVLKQVADFLTFGIFHNDKIQITVTASDVAPSAGLATATLYRQNNSGEWEQLGDPASVTDEGTFVFVVPVDEVGSEEDVYFNEALAVKVEDAVGHSDGPTRLSAISDEDTIDSDTVLIETVAPVVSKMETSTTEEGQPVEVDGEKWFDEQTITFSFTVSDVPDGTLEEDASGLQRVQVYDANNEYYPENPEAALVLDQEFTNADKEVTWSTSDITSEKVVRGNDGSYHLVIVATDNAGNQNEPVDFIVYQDLKAPELTGIEITPVQQSTFKQVINFLSFGNFCKQQVQITITATDAAPSAGLATATLTGEPINDSEQRITATAEPQDGKYTFTVPAEAVGTEEEVYFNQKLSVEVLDRVGNSTGATRLSAISNEDDIDSDTVLIETVAPVIGEITVESTEPNAVVEGQEWYHDVIYFTIPISDSDSGINNYQITINDEVVADWQLPEDGSQVFSETVSVNTTGIQAKEDGSYVLEVAVEDNAGNTNTDEKPVYYETTQPKLTNISRSPENPVYQNENDGKNWYDGDIKYTLSIADQLTGEENEVFSGLNHVSITINDTNCYSWNATEGAAKVGELAAKVGELNDISISTQDIAPTEEGAYNLEVTFYDNAGNENTYTETVYKDIDAPYISNITFTPITDNSDGALNNTPVETEYGYYFTTDTQVTIQALDDNGPSSGINTITYYLDDVEDDSEPTYVEEQVDSNGTITFTIPANFKGQIYAKATDNVDNTPVEGGADGKGYVTPDGVILETQDKHNQENHITFTKEDTPYRDANGLELYGSDVPVNITITDTYSGIRRVEWSVTAPYDTANNQSGVVDVENNGDLSQDGWITDQENNLVTAMNTTINVSNDSNGIVLSVTMTDRAGNTSTQSIQFSVDKTAPVIDVVYDNNSPDATYTDIYQADRTATITVTERNFNAADIQTAITNTDGVIPTLTGWEEHWNATDPNASYYVAHVSYTADGDYTFDIGYTDRAGHAAAAVPQHRFTIDKTIPTLSVSYNNNNMMNGNYYNAQRTATITIVEHNFDPTRVTVLGTATDNGAASVFPTLGGWTTQGDTHTATLLYAADGLYTFDIEFNDMAGNAIADFAPQTFYVDQTAPTLEITGVGNQSANNGTVAPVITFFDTNFNPDAVSISLSGVNNGTVNYAGAYEEIANGRRFTYADFEHIKQVDDIYTLTVSLTDRAGNVTTQTITFSANRFGSTYDLTDLADLSGKFVQTEEDVVFEEINVDALNHDTIRVVMTKNGTPVDLVEGTDYTVEVTGGNGQWSVYRYIINRSLFVDDGRYTISVYSVDSAGNINENIDEAKQAEISFGVDKTAPVIVSLDLDNGAQYPVQVKDTTVEIRDNLVLENVTIYLNDQAVEYQENEESYQFSIPETNSLQDVRIVAEDAAGNRQEVTVADFLVSTNFFVRWYNNTPLFIGTIAGVVVIALGITAFLVFGRRKKKDEEQEEG